MEDSGSPHESSNADGETQSAKAGPATRIGVALILLSGVLWFSLFAIPFLPISFAKKGIIAGIVFIGVQVAWWSGAALAGPATVKKVKSLFLRKR